MMTFEEKLNDDFLNGTLSRAVGVLAFEETDPMKSSVLWETQRRLNQAIALIAPSQELQEQG
jgi:hypothetical protein